MMDTGSANKKAHFDLDNPDAKLTKFLRCYREVYGKGTIAPDLIDVG